MDPFKRRAVSEGVLRETIHISFKLSMSIISSQPGPYFHEQDTRHGGDSVFQSATLMRAVCYFAPCKSLSIALTK